ncbi:MAG TPA: hypothetical protein VFY93_05355 [Planctomycetota bacterium]|nr:hypothetical protein [Planctomycetota bacterium]
MPFAHEQGERQRLAAADALLALGSRQAAEVAWELADSVLGTDMHAIADDDAYALVGQRAAGILLAGVDGERGAACAGKILARIGTPAATDVFLRLAGTGRPGAAWLACVDNPASVPRLAGTLAAPGRPGAWLVACALANSAEGRAELRRFLDPGIDWALHADAKVAALAALAGRFREAADLDAIERAVVHRPTALPAAIAALRRASPPQAAADGALAAWNSERRSAIRAFLATHAGGAIEEAVRDILLANPDPALPTARR